MNEEQVQILHMVQAGQITPDEAERLLAALESAPTAPPVKDTPIPRPDSLDSLVFPRYWEIPFLMGLLLLAFSGWCATSVSSPLLALCGWTVFIGAAVLALASWWSRGATWAHVRIKERAGRRIKISLPVPARLFAWGLRVARRFVDEKTAENLEAAAGLLAMLTTLPDDEPITIEVDEPDGDHIRVFIG